MRTALPPHARGRLSRTSAPPRMEVPHSQVSAEPLDEAAHTDQSVAVSGREGAEAGSRVGDLEHAPRVPQPVTFTSIRPLAPTALTALSMRLRAARSRPDRVHEHRDLADPVKLMSYGALGGAVVQHSVRASTRSTTDHLWWAPPAPQRADVPSSAPVDRSGPEPRSGGPACPSVVHRVDGPPDGCEWLSKIVPQPLEPPDPRVHPTRTLSDLIPPWCIAVGSCPYMWHCLCIAPPGIHAWEPSSPCSSAVPIRRVLRSYARLGESKAHSRPRFTNAWLGERSVIRRT